MTTFYRAKLSVLPNREKPSVTQLKTVLFNKIKVYVTNIYPTKFGYELKTDDPQDYDKILNDNKSLETIGLRPITPPAILAKRTLFIRQLDPEIGEKSANDLIKEITRLQPKLNIQKIIKIPNKNKQFKILFSDTLSAVNTLKHGFKLFNFKVTPLQISQETVVAFNICYKCYMFDDHETKNCKRQQHCSDCTKPGHSHKNCPSPGTSNCINCKAEGNDYLSHHTLALSCPYRKNLIKKLRPPLDSPKPIPAAARQPLPTPKPLLPLPKPNPNTTYAKALTSSTTSTNYQAVLDRLEQKDLIKLTACIVTAVMCSSDVSTINQDIADNINHNFGTDFKLPPIPTKKIETAIKKTQNKAAKYIANNPPLSPPKKSNPVPKTPSLNAIAKDWEDSSSEEESPPTTNSAVAGSSPAPTGTGAPTTAVTPKKPKTLGSYTATVEEPTNSPNKEKTPPRQAPLNLPTEETPQLPKTYPNNRKKRLLTSPQQSTPEYSGKKADCKPSPSQEDSTSDLTVTTANHSEQHNS